MNNLKRSSAIALICFAIFSVLLLIVMSVSSAKALKNGSSRNNSAISSGAGLSGEDERIDYVCSEFVRSIKDGDYRGLKDMVSPSGLIVIKNYTYRDGVRGRDLRNTYTAEEIPENMCFSVISGGYISLKEIFESVKDIKVKNMRHSNLERINFDFKTNEDKKTVAPSTEEIWAICQSIRAAGGKELCPEIYNLGESEFVLTFSEYNTGRGSWAVFEKNKDKCYLRAVLDFR